MIKEVVNAVNFKIELADRCFGFTARDSNKNEIGLHVQRLPMSRRYNLVVINQAEIIDTVISEAVFRVIYTIVYNHNNDLDRKVDGFRKDIDKVMMDINRIIGTTDTDKARDLINEFYNSNEDFVRLNNAVKGGFAEAIGYDKVLAYTECTGILRGMKLVLS